MKQYKIQIYPKGELCKAWVKDAMAFTKEPVAPPRCLRCGKPLCSYLPLNARSRVLKLSVCPECGADEALRAASREELPLCEWWAVREGHLPQQMPPSQLALKPTCSFSNVFQEQPTEAGYPPSLAAYSRNDYDGYRWWTTWFTCQQDKPSPELVEEIDAFQNGLFRMAEFKTLQTMAAMCRQSAEATSDETEFNLYSETQHFYIWLHLITRRGDYNLYVKYFLK